MDAASAGSSTALTNEVTRATAAENTLTTNLNTEVTRATTAENTLTTADLNTEVTDRTNGDAASTTDLNNESPCNNRQTTKEDVADKSTNVLTDSSIRH